MSHFRQDLTEYISVGSSHVPYNDFHVIFNMNYPENGQEYGKMSRENYNYRTIWKIGIRNEACSHDLDLFRQAILVLRFMIQETKESLPAPPRVLFQCSTGQARSMALAVAYWALTEGISVDRAMERIPHKGILPEIMDLLRKEIPGPK